MLLGLATNWLAAGLLAFTIFFYAVVYTMWLKRSTPQNIVIGGAAGAFPPMIGWAAVTGDGQPRRAAAVPHHLPVDPAALLGAGALQAGRLRRRRHPDAAQRRQVALRAGETKTVFYKVTNVGAAATTGIASYNVTPEAAGGYFNKIECFCFTEQTLQPGEPSRCRCFLRRSRYREGRAEGLAEVTSPTTSPCPIPSSTRSRHREADHG
jgi:hypothetical protein